MFRELLGQIDGLVIYGVGSMIMFFIVFMAIVIRTMTMDRQVLEQAARLPLDREHQPLSNGDEDSDQAQG
ncbi:MAG: hypothetical protein V3W14_10540 [Candidatus Neomarinimicrobiota bacterium]